MRRLSRLLLWGSFLGALALLVGLVLLARQSLRQSPRQAYEAAARSAFGPDRDPEVAFRGFDFALRGALAADDTDLAVEVLRARGRLYTAMGSLNRGRRDYEELLTRFRPDDLESQLALVRLLLRQEEDDEALKRIDQVLRRHPGNASALASRGQLLVRQAQEQLRLAQEVIDVMLPERDRARAGAQLRRIAALSQSQPERARRMQLVRGLFPASSERQVQSIFERARSAGGHMRRAREALTDSFAGQRSGDTLVSFLDLADQAGETEAAIAFALGTARLPTAAAQPAFLERTLELLRANGQMHLAAEALGILLSDNVGGPPLYERWCKLLYDQRRWSDLVGVANALYSAGDRAQRSRAMAYMGLAEAKLGRWTQVLGVLRRYVVSDPVEPFPGALPLCWVALSRGWREEGRPEEELSTLRRAMMPSVRIWSGPALDGELWLRLAELAEGEQAVLRGRGELERVLTYAICRLPERLDELWPRWEDVGRRNLVAANVDLQLVLEEMLLDANFSTPATASPYEIFQLAGMLKARDLATPTLRACSRLLRDYPGFLPALDLAIETRQGIGDLGGAARLLLERLELLPGDRATIERLEELSSVALRPVDVLQLMQADPAGAARDRLLLHLERRGLPSVAAAGLLSLPEEALRPEDQLRAARLLLDLGHPDQIEVALERLSPRRPYAEQALALRLTAAAQLGDWDAFDLLLADLEGLEAIDGPGLEALLERLLLRSPDRVAVLAGQLDEGLGWRSGTLLLRLAQARELLGERVSAHTELTRADAFLADGAPELGYLLEVVAARDWGRMPDRVGELRRSNLQRTPLVDALLDALGERPGQATKAITENARRQDAEPLWVLTDAGLTALLNRAPRARPSWWSEELDEVTREVLGGEGRDPRQVLALALALQHPQWRAWAVTRTMALGTGELVDALWPAYLAARGLVLLGEIERAQELALDLVERWPSFRPGWRLLELTDRRASERAVGGPGRMPREQPDSISWVRWRQRELLGPRSVEAAEEHWMNALEIERQGDPRLAQRTLARALELRPEDLRLRLTQIRLYASDRDWVPALQSMNRAIELTPELSDGVVAERALSLRRAALAGAPRESIQEPLGQLRELLAGRFPDDPLVAVELARMEVTSAPAGADVGLGRALARLDAFRSRTKGVPLDQLRAGASRAWFDFLLPFDPVLAYELAARELRATPGDHELWRLLAEALEARGDLPGAIGVLEVLQQALAFPADARSLVRLQARRGVDRDAFEDAFAAVLAQEALAEPDPELLLARGTFLMNSGPYGWDEAVETLGRLWWKRRPQSQRSSSKAAAESPVEPQVLREIVAVVARLLLWPDRAAAGSIGDDRPDPAGGQDAAAAPVDPQVLREIAEACARVLLWRARPEGEQVAEGAADAPALAPLNPRTWREVTKAYALVLLWRGRPEDERLALRLLDDVMPNMRWQTDAWVLRGLREVLAGRLRQGRP